MRTHTNASKWRGEDVSVYAERKHGPDGAKFLDPILIELMREMRLSLKNLLDIGAGTGMWTKWAIDNGVRKATAVDLSQAMIDKAKANLSTNRELDPRVTLLTGDAANLPLELKNDTYNFLLSSLVGCNLPKRAFKKHFSEAYRVAEPGAEFIVAAPHSLLIPFTTANGSVADLQKQIDTEWRAGADPKEIIKRLPGVLRATFILDKKGKPVLLTEDNADKVKSGDPILRAIPGPLAVDNNFHEAEEYHQSAEKAGWKVIGRYELCFQDDEEREAYNRSLSAENQLGPEYVGNSLFLVLELEK